MRAVEVDRGDPGRIGDQIRQHVTAARCDGDDLMSRADVERLHVDDRVLPDLRIDEAFERKRKHALEHAGARQRLRAMDPQPLSPVAVARRTAFVEWRTVSLSIEFRSRAALDESRDDGVTGGEGRRRAMVRRAVDQARQAVSGPTVTTEGTTNKGYDLRLSMHSRPKACATDLLSRLVAVGGYWSLAVSPRSSTSSAGTSPWMIRPQHVIVEAKITVDQAMRVAMRSRQGICGWIWRRSNSARGLQPRR